MERLGKVSLMTIDPNKKLNIDYMYTQRVIFFQVLSDTIRTVIPFLKIESILRFLSDEISFGNRDEENCVVCGEETIVSPMKYLNCQHHACYLCYSGLSEKICSRCRV